MAINLYEASPHFMAVSSTRIHAASEQPMIINVNLDQLLVFSPSIIFIQFLIKIDEDSDDEDEISAIKNKSLPLI